MRLQSGSHLRFGLPDRRGDHGDRNHYLCYFYWWGLCRKLFRKQVRKESRVCWWTDLSSARGENSFDTSGYFINNRKNEGGNVYGGDDAVNSFITGGICFID